MPPFPRKTPLKFIVGAPIAPPDIPLGGEVSLTVLSVESCTYLASQDGNLHYIVGVVAVVRSALSLGP